MSRPAMLLEGSTDGNSALMHSWTLAEGGLVFCKFNRLSWVAQAGLETMRLQVRVSLPGQANWMIRAHTAPRHELRSTLGYSHAQQAPITAELELIGLGFQINSDGTQRSESMNRAFAVGSIVHRRPLTASHAPSDGGETVPIRIWGPSFHDRESVR